MSKNMQQSPYKFIRLATKPSAQLCYSLTRAVSPRQSDTSLIVFVNGLGLAQTGWEDAIANLLQSGMVHLPSMLTYDRFGQGQTVDRDPNDQGAADPSHGHDCVSAIRDMHQLVTQIIQDEMGIANVDDVELLMVGNSIGCALIRLYAQHHPGTLAGALFLDSTLTNSDFVSLFPDPDAPDFDQDGLPPGVTPENLRLARQRFRALFHPDVGNKEGLSRRNIGQLLPDAHLPPLRGTGGRGPLVTVLGHDFDAFAVDTEEKLGIPRELSQIYVNTYWHRYNEGLAKLTEPQRSQGPFQAPGAGHFIQADNPGLVAEKIIEMLESQKSKVR